MNTSRRFTGYDLFKLVVAIALLILFLLLNRKTTPGTPPAVFTPFSDQNPTVVPSPKGTDAVSSSLTSTQAVSLTATTKPTIPLSSPTPTLTVEPTATTPTSPASTPAASITSTPKAGAVMASACDSASSHSRLKVGDQAVLLRRLNFRSSPGIQENWLRTNLAGTKVEVMDGPQCIPYVNGAYVWWQIKLPDGEIGWSAEASQLGSFSFMEPEQ